MRPWFVAILAGGCGFEIHAQGTGGEDGPPGIDAATPCVAAEFPRCAGEDLEICVGGFAMPMDCGYGCVGPAPAHCGDPRPSNGVDPAWIPPAPFGGALAVTAAQIIVADTGTGQIRICGGGDLRAAGSGIIAGIDFRRVTSSPLDHGVFALDTMTVATGGTLRWIGDVPGIVLAKGPIVVDGTIDLSGGLLACDFASACGVADDRRCSGPGPGLGGGDSADGSGTGRGGRGNVGGASSEHGGGGGGFGAVGGKGGGSDGGSFGIVYGTATLTPLVAGSGGGGGRSGGSTTLYGGGGGGGLQLTSLGSISITGTIKASGGGGGYGGNTFGHGGGGGGSGGALLLEAANLTITGAVTANGGGGGAGKAPSLDPSNGEDGRGDATAAFGGSGAGAFSGGNGGMLTVPTGRQGLPITNTPSDGSGGGGGGVGRIYLRSRAGGIMITGGTVSPMPAATGDDYLQ